MIYLKIVQLNTDNSVGVNKVIGQQIRYMYIMTCSHNLVILQIIYPTRLSLALTNRQTQSTPTDANLSIQIQVSQHVQAGKNLALNENIDKVMITPNLNLGHRSFCVEDGFCLRAVDLYVKTSTDTILVLSIPRDHRFKSDINIGLDSLETSQFPGIQQ